MIMNRPVLPAKLTTGAITMLCAASMLCSAQSPYRPLPNQTWNKTVALDTAFMRVSYEMTFRDALFYSTSEPGGLEDHVFAEKEILSDTRIVEFGDRVRKDYSQILETREMLNREMTERGEMPRNLGSSSVYPIELFIFSDSYRINRRTLLTGPILQYEGGCTPMQWSLTGEAEQVGDYQCQKAVTSFGGREWTAWFCPDIPVDGGPYKFRGLPGLILKVEDSEKHFSWTMTGIEKGSWPIYEKQYLFQKCSPKEAAKILKDMYLRPFVFLKNTGIRTLLPDGKGGAREPGDNEYSVAMYYDPIELE